MGRKLSSTTAYIQRMRAHAVSAGIATLRSVVKIFTLTCGMLSSLWTLTIAETAYSYRYMLPYGLKLGVNLRVEAQRTMGGLHDSFQVSLRNAHVRRQIGLSCS
jgi:hypothetical protein